MSKNKTFLTALAALLPALWLMRRQPAELVKVFANER